MRRFRCTVSYKGRNYDGWQSQRNGRSVQETIEAAIERIACERTVITAAGRTDAGVNAHGQVFHFDSDKDLSAYKWKGAINGFLPDDIHIMDIEETDETFHARYCVRMKQYDYRIQLRHYDVLTSDYAWQCPYELDIDRMKEAAGYLKGTHDFTAFNSSSLQEYPDQVRTVKDIVFEQQGDLLKISFIGKGFLRYMVRMMTAQIIEAGRGKIEPEEIADMLESRSRTGIRRNAEPQGLTLEKIDYFEICALNEEGMIREYLDGDILPEGYSLEELEEAVRKRELPRLYAFSTRHSQTILGRFEVLNSEEGRICLYDPKNSRKAAESLLEQLRKWAGKNGYPDTFTIRIEKAAD